MAQTEPTTTHAAPAPMPRHTHYIVYVHEGGWGSHGMHLRYGVRDQADVEEIVAIIRRQTGLSNIVLVAWPRFDPS